MQTVSITEPVVVLQMKGNRKQEVTPLKRTHMAWYNVEVDRTMIVVRVPFTFGKKLVAELVGNVTAFYQRHGCQADTAVYHPKGVSVLQLYK